MPLWARLVAALRQAERGADAGPGLPETPMAHTSSGGLHCLFVNPERELKCSAGLIGPGLDVRAEGGYVIVPSMGSGYCWNPLWNLDTVAPLPAPEWLRPRRPEPAAGEDSDLQTR